MWYSSTVLPGNQDGRTIGFPTINLDVNSLPATTKQGVYAATVKIQGQEHLGALYYGPRLVKKETHLVLEIHILDFNGQLYGQTVSYKLGAYIRGVRDFASFEEMQKQLSQDIKEVRSNVDKASG